MPLHSRREAATQGVEVQIYEDCVQRGRGLVASCCPGTSQVATEDGYVSLLGQGVWDPIVLIGTGVALVCRALRIVWDSDPTVSTFWVSCPGWCAAQGGADGHGLRSFGGVCVTTVILAPGACRMGGPSRGSCHHFAGSRGSGGIRNEFQIVRKPYVFTVKTSPDPP